MHLTRDDLYTLEAYQAMRDDFRAETMAHKKDRAVAIGANATLYFESRQTILYQIQEMLRIEKIFDADGINEELETYNPMIPDGNNFKATFMIEFGDEDERRAALGKWIGIEKAIWVKVGDFDKVFAICNEDLERENEHKTAAVHFMRFQLSDEMRAAACAGEVISAGCDFPLYQHQQSPLTVAAQNTLKNDLNCVG